MKADIETCLKYLETGGLGEVIGFTSISYELDQPKVQSDTDLMMAILILAQEALDNRKNNT